MLGEAWREKAGRDWAGKGGHGQSVSTWNPAGLFVDQFHQCSQNPLFQSRWNDRQSFQWQVRNRTSSAVITRKHQLNLMISLGFLLMKSLPLLSQNASHLDSSNTRTRLWARAPPGGRSPQKHEGRLPSSMSTGLKSGTEDGSYLTRIFMFFSHLPMELSRL